MIQDTLGTIHRGLGDLDAAFVCYQTAAELFDGYESADEYDGLLALADAYAASGRARRAREIWASVAVQAQGYPYVIKRAEDRLRGSHNSHYE
jgi:tetratricopeptide (TPR) repeat protein